MNEPGYKDAEGPYSLIDSLQAIHFDELCHLRRKGGGG